MWKNTQDKLELQCLPQMSEDTTIIKMLKIWNIYPTICQQIEPVVLIKETKLQLKIGTDLSVHAGTRIYLIWIIIPDIQKLCHLKIQLLITYPISSIFAKLGISNVGRTDNGTNECRRFTKYCNSVHYCLDVAYHCVMMSWKWYWALLMFQKYEDSCSDSNFSFLNIHLKNSGLIWTLLNERAKPRKPGLRPAEMLFSRRLKTTQIYGHYGEKELYKLSWQKGKKILSP